MVSSLDFRFGRQRSVGSCTTGLWFGLLVWWQVPLALVSNIEEDMEFTKVLIVKPKLEENFCSLGTELTSSVGTLETNTC
jgi:hypothetical protein